MTVAGSNTGGQCKKPVPHALFAVPLGQCGRAMAASFWLGIAAIAVRFETAGFANLGKADSICPTVFGGALWLFVVLLRPWA